MKSKKTTMNTRKNSWYLRTGMTHHFICKCGQTDKFMNVLSDEYHPSHRCSQCQNDYYIDSMMFLTNKKVTQWSAFYWNVETQKTESDWIARAYDFIPLFDYELQKIRFRKVYICTISLSFNAEKEFHEDSSIIMNKNVYNNGDKAIQFSNFIFEYMEKVLFDFVLDTPTNTISWIESKELYKLSVHDRICLVVFFLKHSHLKEYDFFYWSNFLIFAERSKEYPSVQLMLDFVFNHRREKSIRKAYYKAYANSMDVRGKYNHIADYIFSRYITDRNFLLALINMNIEVKHKIFNDTSMQTVANLIEFLKEHYDERTITKFFLDIDTYTHTMRDISWMYRGNGENYVQEHFVKIPLTLENLHDELVRIHSLCNTSFSQKIDFEYHPNDLNAEFIKKPFEFRLPKTTHCLTQWAKNLDNCMSSYAMEIHKRNTIVFGVFKEDILSYAVEIRDHKIVQARGYDNKDINLEDREEIEIWFKDVYLNSWIKAHSVK